ncbi:MAG: 2-keto-4-methylthiobutyrate aminotransferase, partial [Candidatus Dadabacteria bacterium]
MYCFLNGRYVDVRQARISPLDRGFLFGEGLFETWRTYRGRPFAVAEHLRRMQRSARALGIPFDPNEPWEARTLRLARLNGLARRSGAVRLTITRGPGPVTLLPRRPYRPTRLMVFRPLEPGLAEARRKGVAACLHPFGAGVHAGLRQIKTVNYLPAIV